MMRRALLALGLATLLSAPMLRAQDTVSVGIAGQLTGLIGDSLHVPVYADMTRANGALLGSYTLRITWNPNILFLQGVGDGAFSSPVIQTDSSGNGVLYASGISAQGLGGQFNLFDLHFTPLDTTADSVRLGVTEMSAAGTLADLRATATILTRNAPYCAARGRWGDVDGDGLANSRDALAILSSLVGLTVPSGFDLTLGDADGDGLTNSRDALILLSYAVGFAIPGQRVLLPAAGACAGTTPQLTVLPDTVDLVVGQAVTVRAFGRDASGQPVSLADLQWATADPLVAAVDESGSVTGRTAGTTTLTAAVGPGVQVTVPVVIRARRGTWYVDAQRAKLASVQLGTQTWPFATPQYAFPLVSEGDTIRIAPGVVDYESATVLGCGTGCLVGAPPSRAPQATIGTALNAGVVVIGDTLADGTRPELRGLSATSAFEWDGGQHAELHNVVLRGFYYGVDLAGVRTFIAQNVDFRDTLSTYGYGIYGSGYVDTLRVLDSQFASDTTSYGYGVYVGNGAGYVGLRNVTADYVYYPVYAYNVDSLDVAQSHFTNSYYQGIYAYSTSPHTLGVRLSQNRIAGTRSGAGVYLNGVRGVATDHNYFGAVTNDGLDVYGPSSTIAGGSRVAMVGDSIQFRAAYNYWADIEDVDSILMDSLWVEDRPDSALYQYSYLWSNYARVTNSQLLHVYGQGLAFYGRRLDVSGLQVTGCDTCTWNSSYGIQAYAGNDSGPRVQVSGSSFFNLAYGVYLPYGGTGAGPLALASSAFDSVATGVYAYADSQALTDNAFANVRSYALWSRPSYTTGRSFVEAQVLRNRVTCAVVSGYYSYGVLTYEAPARLEGNHVQDCRYGLYAYNYSYPTATVTLLGDTILPDSTTYDRYGIRVDGKWQPTISANRVTGGYYGIGLSTTDGAVAATLDSNVVTGTGYAGIYLYYLPGPVAGSYNNVYSNGLYGVYDYVAGTGHGLTQGRFVGNAAYAVYTLGSNFAFDATSNWWGAATGPHTPGADSVLGNITTAPYDTTDPGGVTVPLAPPFTGVAAAAPAPAAPVGAALSAPPVSPAAPDASGVADVRARHAERRAAREATRAVHARAAREAVERRAPPGAKRQY